MMQVQQLARPQAAARGRYLVLAIVMLATFTATLDFTIVNLGLDDISRALGTSLGVVEWVVLSYALTMAALLLGAGRLADMYGTRRLFLLGMVIFTVGSGLCAIAPTIGALIAARVVQAGGGALLQALGAALVTLSFPGSERGRAIGLVLMAASLGSVAGPGLGGVLLSVWGWESLFAVNVPVGIAVTLLAWYALPPDRAPVPARFDLAGLLLFVPSSVALVLALTRAPYEGASASVLALCLGSLTLLGVFWWWEGRNAAPLLDLSLFRSRVFTLQLLLLVAGPLNYGWQLFLLPFALRSVLSLDTIQAGLLILCMPLGYGLASGFSGYLADRFNPRYLMVVGLGFATLGVILLSQIEQSWRGGDVVWRLMLIGVGQGLYQTPNQNVLLGSVPRDRLGVVGGLFGVVRQLALSLGAALGGALWVGGALAASGQLGVPSSAVAAQVAGVTLSLLVLAAVQSGALLLALLAPLKERVVVAEKDDQ
jgi:EmrB/QacA subfamily drug resistance transporter